MYWLIALLIVGIIGYLLDREIYTYEGVRLGPRVQAWLYDRWSKKYDAGKGESQLRDGEMLAQPLLEKLHDVPQPFVLDFATGTGRMSYALLQHQSFKGHIIALDISQGMLEQAAEKLSFSVSVEFLRHQTLPLPFGDATFDVVCCLEVLELLPDAQAALDEMSRVLRPGGVLLTSRGTAEAGPARRARIKSEAQMTSMLERSGFENISITPWWKWFDRIFADRKGTSSPVGARSLMEVLRCTCGQIGWQTSPGAWTCAKCGRVVKITDEQIVLN